MQVHFSIVHKLLSRSTQTPFRVRPSFLCALQCALNVLLMKPLRSELLIAYSTVIMIATSRQGETSELKFSRKTPNLVEHIITVRLMHGQNDLGPIREM